MRVLILLLLIFLNSLSAIASPKNKNPCEALLQANYIMNESKVAHYSVKKYTTQNTQDAIIKFIKIIDPLELTVYQSELSRYSNLSAKDLIKIHKDRIYNSNADFFYKLAVRAKKRLDHLMFKFRTDKTYRDTAISKFETLTKQSDKKHISIPRSQNLNDAETQFIDLIVADMLNLSSKMMPAKTNHRIINNSSLLLILATRNIRWVLHKIYRNLQADYVPIILSKAYIQSLDPHSDLEIPTDSAHMLDDLAGDSVGIGVQLEQNLNGLKVVDIFNDTPAQQANIQNGDIITHILSSETKYASMGAEFENKWILTRNISPKDAPLYISGPADSKVKLKILRNNKTHEIEITRKSYSLSQNHINIQLQASANGTLAHVYIDSFYKGLGEDLRSGLEALLKDNKISGIALDLRENGGGSIFEIGKLLGLFIKSGAAIHTQSHNGVVDTLDIPATTPIWLGPLVVMTSPMSASAAEATAGAFRDYGRGLIVGGDTTFGKGSMQQFFALNENGSLAISVTRGLYFTPNGTTPQLDGVRSDVILPQPKELDDYPSESNFQNVIPPITLKNIEQIDTTHSQINSAKINSLKEKSLLRQKSWSRLNYYSEVFDRNTQESLDILSDLTELQN